MAIASSLRTASLDCIAPTTVPASVCRIFASTRALAGPVPASHQRQLLWRRWRGMAAAVRMPGVLRLGALRQARVQFHFHQPGAGGDHIAGAAGDAQQLARIGRGTSTTAFAVSIDTIGWSRWMTSPTLTSTRRFRHRAGLRRGRAGKTSCSLPCSNSRAALSRPPGCAWWRRRFFRRSAGISFPAGTAGCGCRSR